MTFQSGSAISYYILDISDAERKAAQLRSLYQGIRQDAASLSQPIVAPTSNNGSVAKPLQDAAKAATLYSTATQQLIADTVALGASQGLTNDQINSELAAMSRAALAAGNYAAANELIEASLGKEAEILPINTKEHEKAAQAIEREANADLRLAETQARALRASGDQTGALRLLTNARQNATNASEQAIASADVQIASLEKTATVSGAATNALGALVNPLVLIGAAAVAATAVFKSFDDALSAQTAINEQRVAFDGLIGNISQGNIILDKAITSTRDYGITAKQTTEAFKDLAPYIRDSTSSVDAQTGALERISTLNPAAPAQALASAIEGINSGRIVTLRRELGLTAPEATKLVTEVKQGKDVFIALNEVLDKQGFTLQVAKDRMQGYGGAEREAQLAGENLQKSEAKFALGPGLALKKAETFSLNYVTELLSGNVNILTGNLDTLANAGYNPVNIITAKAVDINGAFINKIEELTSGTFPKLTLGIDAVYKGYTDIFGVQTKLPTATDKATQGLQREADADDRYTGATYKAVTATDALTTAQYAQARAALVDQRAGERSGGLFDTLAETTSFYDKQHVASATAAQDAKTLQSAELNYAKATNNTVEERKILNAQLKAANGDHAEELNIKAQIAQLDNQKTKAPKGLSGLDRTEITLAGTLQQQLDEVNRRLENGKLTQLQRNQLLIDQEKLQTKINDAVQKERDLQIGIGLDQVHDAQKRIEETTELAGLQRAEKDSRFDATQQQAIRLREQEILLDQQKRANDLSKAQTQLNNDVHQTGVGAAQAVTTAAQTAIPVSQLPPIGSGVPATSQGVPQAGLSTGEKITINLTVNVDKNGIPTAIQPNPAIALNLIAKSLGVQVASGIVQP